MRGVARVAKPEYTLIHHSWNNRVHIPDFWRILKVTFSKIGVMLEESRL